MGLDDFISAGMLTAACSGVVGYWSNKEEDASPNQYILRCLGKRSHKTGITWDLQDRKSDPLYKRQDFLKWPSVNGLGFVARGLRGHSVKSSYRTEDTVSHL